MSSDESPEGARPQEHGTLVVLNDAGDRLAVTTMWLRDLRDAQMLIAIPRLRLEYDAAMKISAGRGLGEVFDKCWIRTTGWYREAVFVGGSWQMWRRGTPELWEVGFVMGRKMNLELALRGLKTMFAERS